MNIKKLKTSSELLVDKLGLDKNEIRAYILDLFRFTDNFLMHVNFTSDPDPSLNEKL